MKKAEKKGEKEEKKMRENDEGINDEKKKL